MVDVPGVDVLIVVVDCVDDKVVVDVLGVDVPLVVVDCVEDNIVVVVLSATEVVFEAACLLLRIDVLAIV